MSELRIQVALSGLNNGVVSVTVVDTSGRVYSVIWQRPVLAADLPLQLNFSPALTEILGHVNRIRSAERSVAAGRGAVSINPLDRDASVIVESVNRAARQLATESPENQALSEQIRSIREQDAAFRAEPIDCSPVVEAAASMAASISESQRAASEALASSSDPRLG